MTVTGLTLGENLERWTHKYGGLPADQDVIRPLNNPIKETGHIRSVCDHHRYMLSLIHFPGPGSYEAILLPRVL